MSITATKVIGIAARELGYLEKATNADLDSKYANPGHGNFTKYARDLNIAGFYNGNKNGFAWCAVFVDWCVWMTAGKNKAETLRRKFETSDLGAGCVYVAQFYRDAGRWFTTPKAGDQIFFYDSDREEGHTGLVEKVEGGQVHTIEGNRDNCVKRYSYPLGDWSIAGYGRPMYDAEEAKEPEQQTEAVDLLGIDVAGDQGVVDWPKVKAAGIKVAIIKFGNIYETEELYTDSKFVRNVQECERVGMPYGVYVFTYAATQARFTKEIKKAIARIKETCAKISYPVYLDLEDPAVISNGKVNLLSMVQSFVAVVKNAGLVPGVYSSTSWWEAYLTDPWYDAIERWVADWRGACYYKGKMSAWQYTEKGSVAGISVNVDMDRFYFSPGALAAPAIQKGDVNGDGKVNAADARKVLRASAKLVNLTDEERKRADMNNDGKITAADAKEILKHGTE